MVFGSGCLRLFLAIVPSTLFWVIHQENTELTPTVLSVTSLSVVLALLLQVGSSWVESAVAATSRVTPLSAPVVLGSPHPSSFNPSQDGSRFVAVLIVQSSEMQNYRCSGSLSKVLCSCFKFWSKDHYLFSYLEIFISWGYLSISHLEKRKKREPHVPAEEEAYGHPPAWAFRLYKIVSSSLIWSWGWGF